VVVPVAVPVEKKKSPSLTIGVRRRIGPPRLVVTVRQELVSVTIRSSPVDFVTAIFVLVAATPTSDCPARQTRSSVHWPAPSLQEWRPSEPVRHKRPLGRREATFERARSIPSVTGAGRSERTIISGGVGSYAAATEASLVARRRAPT